MMNIGKSFAIFIFVCGVLNLCWGSQKSREGSSDDYLPSAEVIRKYGYPVEVHKVVTEDGYILELHRIPHGRNPSSSLGIPILLAHGFTGSSIQFLLLKTESLPFLLADAGYDVWLINFRGCSYSRSHRVLSPKDSKFWNFSWHEHGVYDIPANIDYILGYTRMDQLIYIGYSMGTTSFFVMASTKPEYQKKIRGAILLGPTSYVGHARTPLKHFSIFSKTLKGPLEVIGHEEVFEDTPEQNYFSKTKCVDNLLCKKILFLLSATITLEEFNTSIASVSRGHFPDSTSLKSIAHFGQLMIDGRFQQYDYGVIKNLKRYHQSHPPEYKLEAITLPLSLIVAPDDLFNSKGDTEISLRRLPNVKSVYTVPKPAFSHAALVADENAKELVFDKVLEHVQYFTNEVK